ncbi:ABC transporter permease [Paramaledivibacter caminithermalis]|jgi:putative ABC transport system permease protein|uniref:Putative ABC transport system permease protein n=1 Tax=Paramaledivibacter caminithermalis (strain DSM 15212 / CIP 107654 / DViRD3) TaxID=1121301 RepID=A0A1M6MS57_PARC5|nr:ABC transporter permease [Paramaledivibacter caminithermalis]SHJ86242.1 putative ABC transport system permease protein [Paramaledivibacter caminithermalis DSM 15212]
MSLGEILRSIFINIRENKTKVFLTTLGIIVGSLTIVLVMAIGNGSQASVEEQFKRLNVGTLYIMPAFGRKKASLKLGIDDMEAIAEEVASISKVSMVINGNANINFYGKSTSSFVTGVMADYNGINNLELEYGEFISEDHSNERFAVIGYELAKLLFEDEEISNPVGEKIIINGKRFEIIGVLKYLGNSERGFNPDEGVFIPYEVAQRYITGKNPGPMIMTLAKDINHIDSAIDEITTVLQKRYGDKSDQFMIRDAGSSLESARNSARTMTLMLLSVATVVLIVGGIGIMNVLFVSVKERTKEIGILKAIGARRKDILRIFLLEAIIISAIGGILGIILSMAAMPILNYFNVRAINTMFGYLLAFGFSVLIGTFFGYYPAAKAASLRPIDALNYE